MNTQQHLVSAAILTFGGLAGTWFSWPLLTPSSTPPILPDQVNKFIAQSVPWLTGADESRLLFDMIGVGLIIPTMYLSGVIIRRTFVKRSSLSLYTGLPVGLVVGVLHGLFGGIGLGVVAGSVTGLLFVSLTNIPFVAVFAPIFVAIVLGAAPTNVLAGWVLLVTIILAFIVAYFLGYCLKRFCRGVTRCELKPRLLALIKGN